MIVSFGNKVIDYVKWLYLQYLLNTALYMLEPFEVRIFNSVILLMTFVCVYSTYIFMPLQFSNIFKWFISNPDLKSNLMVEF